MRWFTLLLLSAILVGPATSRLEAARKQKDPNVIRALSKALEYLKREPDSYTHLTLPTTHYV